MSLRTTGLITLLVLTPAIALAAGLTITPIPLQTFTPSENARTITVEVSNPAQSQLTYSARIVSFGHAAGLVLDKNQDYRNWGGLDERWVLSNDKTWYFITPDGSFYRWNNSGQGSFSTGPVVGKFPVSFYSDLSLLINQPDELGLEGNLSDHRNWGGLDERWVLSKDKAWYFITPDGSFYRWNKSPQTAFTTGPAIGKFPSSFHTDLLLLINQTHVGLEGNLSDHRNWGGLDERWVLSKDKTWYFITPDGSFYRWNDSTQGSFSTGPVISKFSPSFHTDLSLLINQSDELGLQGSINHYRNWGGLDERWVLSKDKTWYFITPDGSFYRWNNSTQASFSTGPAIGKFPSSFHTDLSLLINKSNVQTGNVSMSGSELTMNMVMGTPFGIEVTVQDTAGNKTATMFGVVRPSGDVQTVTKLTVNAFVTNDNGGTKTVADFGYLVDVTPVSSSVQTVFSSGTKIVSVTGTAGYSVTFGGDCAFDGSVILSGGAFATCTVTLDDIPPTLTIIKEVINNDGDNGGASISGNGGHHGNAVDRFTASANFLASDFEQGTAPGGFGGGPDVPFGDTEVSFICSNQKSIPRDARGSFVEWFGTYMASLMGREAPQIIAALKDPTFCALKQAAAPAKPKPLAVHMTKDNVVVSTNSVWNACVIGQGLTKELIMSNADKNMHRQGTVEKFIAKSCDDYNRTDPTVWEHPNYAGLLLKLDTKGRLVGGLPTGYVAVKDGGLDIVKK